MSVRKAAIEGKRIQEMRQAAERAGRTYACDAAEIGTETLIDMAKHREMETDPVRMLPQRLQTELDALPERKRDRMFWKVVVPAFAKGISRRCRCGR